MALLWRKDTNSVHLDRKLVFRAITSRIGFQLLIIILIVLMIILFDDYSHRSRRPFMLTLFATAKRVYREILNTGFSIWIQARAFWLVRKGP